MIASTVVEGRRCQHKVLSPCDKWQEAIEPNTASVGGGG